MALRTSPHWPRLFFLVPAMILLLTPSALGKTQAPLSDAMKSLLQQANTQYMSLFGSTVDKMANEDPLTLASILGLTLQRQTTYALDNPQYGNQYFKLREECLQLLKFIATEKDYKNPRDGSPMPLEDVEKMFFDGISGIPNGFFLKKFGFDPATVDLPMILAQVAPSQQGGAMEPDSHNITLGGETAPGAESSVQGGRVGLPPEQDPTPLDAVGNFPGNEAYKVQGRMCPVQHPGGWGPEYNLDTNNNPNDDTKVSCYYTIRQGEQKLLSNQVSYVNGKQHGTYLSFEKDQNGKVYLKSNYEYNQGEQWQGAAFGENGKMLFSLQRKDGARISMQFRPDGSKKNMRVEKGGQSMDEEYHPNGQISIRYVNGDYAGAWCPDGSNQNPYTGCK